MFIRSYYEEGPLTGMIEITRMVNSKPAEYQMCLMHSVNGLILKQTFESAEKAISKASTLGYISNKWKTKEIK